jgi:ATP-dependent DNA helicase RecQ
MDSRHALQKWFGYADFRGCQAAVIEHLLADRHALVIMPTGGGKSLCYQIPALVHAERDTGSEKPLTLVISPLIALMKDQVDALGRRGIPATFINSSLSRQERDERYSRVAAGEFGLLYVTPERFRKAEFLSCLSCRKIALLAVDEAHCISEWGHDFRPDYTRIADFRKMLGSPTTVALTATATLDVQADIVRHLNLGSEEVEIFHEGIERPNLRLEVRHVWGDEEKLRAIEEVVHRYPRESGSGIVYFSLIRTLMAFSERLRENGVEHVCYHGDLDRNSRRQIQNQFMNGQTPLVLATNAFGMGIDKEDIRFVVHAETPGSVEAWYQEIGRAGRDGRPSECLLLYDQRDLQTQMQFIRWSNPDADIYERVDEVLRRDLEKVHAFGLDWLRDRLHTGGKNDRQLETALSMLERYGVIELIWEPLEINVIGTLPAELVDRSRLAAKLRRDQQKLYSLVELVRHEGDRRDFLREYFGLEDRSLPTTDNTDTTDEGMMRSNFH